MPELPGGSFGGGLAGGAEAESTVVSGLAGGAGTEAGVVGTGLASAAPETAVVSGAVGGGEGLLAGLGAVALPALAVGAAGAAGVGIGIGLDKLSNYIGHQVTGEETGDYSLSGMLASGMTKADQALTSLWADPSKPEYQQTLGWKIADWLTPGSSAPPDTQSGAGAPAPQPATDPTTPQPAPATDPQAAPQAQTSPQAQSATQPPCPNPKPPNVVDVDRVPPSSKHYPCPGDHWHCIEYHQAPYPNCKINGQRTFGGCLNQGDPGPATC